MTRFSVATQASRVLEIEFDGPETEHVDPAVEARHDRYDVDCVHGDGRLAAAGRF